MPEMGPNRQRFNSFETHPFQDFAAAIREHRRPLVDGYEGRKSIEVVQAIYRSARTNAPVSLPLAQS